MSGIEEARAEIEARYLAADSDGLFWEERDPWVVSYSGGKDSTLLLLLVVETARKFGAIRPVYALFSDTGIERDGIVARIARNFAGFEGLGKREGLDFRARVVVPKPEHMFFNVIVGSGYGAPFPPKYRWCVSRLKQQPIADWKRREFGRGRFVTLTGERFAESKNRKESMERRLDANGFYKPVQVVTTKKGVKKRVRKLKKNERMWAPIRNVSSEELWRYLDEFLVYPWGEPKSELLAQYGAETAREIIDGGKERRSGCRFCTFCKDIREGDDTPERRFCRALASLTEKEGSARCLIARDMLENWYNVPKHFKSNARVIEDGYGIGVMTLEARQKVLDMVFDMERETGRIWIGAKSAKIIGELWERDKARIERGELVDAREVLRTS